MDDRLKKAAAYIALGPLGGWIVADRIDSASQAMKEASHGSLENLREEAARQEIQMQFAQHQARVAQELAIAKRIEDAAEVEIEEYYDLSGSGSVGLSGNIETQTVSLGASGEERKVTKRVYRFKGKGNVRENIVQNMVPDK